MSDEQYLYEQVDDIFKEERRREAVERKDKIDALILDMKNVLGSESGRRFIWWVIARGDLFTAPYNGKALDMAHNLGVRTIAAEVFSLALKANPRILETMVNERLKGEAK